MKIGTKPIRSKDSRKKEIVNLIKIASGARKVTCVCEDNYNYYGIPQIYIKETREYRFVLGKYINNKLQNPDDSRYWTLPKNIKEK